MIEKIWNLMTKGTRINGYEFEEFPEYHCENLTPEEKERLRKAWNENPQLWGNPDAEDEDEQQPNWDALFDLAGIE